MAAGVYNITIEQGATFALSLTWEGEDGEPIDLTDFTARMQIRASTRDAYAILELTTENGRIALGGTDGTIALTVSAAVTAGVTAASGVYDLELISPSSFVTRLLKGAVTFDGEATR